LKSNDEIEVLNGFNCVSEPRGLPSSHY
jgi:hypothetical protein